MSLVKVCGVTRPQDACCAAELGADLLGLNFWPHSPRYLEPEAARRVAEAVRGRVQLVGVFVDAPPGWVDEVERRVGLDLLQFHGDEPPQEVRRWGRRAIRVCRLAGPPEPHRLALDGEVWGFLFELRHVDYGGAGKSWDYSCLRGLAGRLERPYLVAGGIGPGNARAALAASGAVGVDVCSGVEAAPGIKDRELIRRLLREVQDGEDFAAAGTSPG